MNSDPLSPTSIHHDRSLAAHLLWRSVLGSSASSSVQTFHSPCCLRDRTDFTRASRRADGASCPSRNNEHALRLLPHPRLVHAVPPSSGPMSFSESAGIVCMDLDRGLDESRPCAMPSRFLLVGSGGLDCSLSLYDLSYFGSDDCLYRRPSATLSSSRQDLDGSSVTHRPVARSLRRNSSSVHNIAAVPSGHRQPLLGVHWYPADRGSFVSSSVSGEILVWDAQSFVPVFATAARVHSKTSATMTTQLTSAVSPVQCVDLPQSPHACPHGRALLALGLGGGDGRGVVQLCDAFGGGSATHELVGHCGGGVTAVAWDPNRPFRLASAGEDGTVRLWDVRKGGRSACLGVLDKNWGYFDGAGHPPTKRQRIDVRHGRIPEGVESHAAPVTALAFASGGNDLVSSASDGSVHLWDLRPDSCYVTSLVATVRKSTFGEERGGMDPAVACGGRLYPFIFNTGTNSFRQSHTKQTSRRNQTSSLAIVQGGSRRTAMVFVTSSGTNNSPSKVQIAGYSLFGTPGREPGGQPDVILNGHLDHVTCLLPIVGVWDNLGVGRCKDTSNVRLLSAGKDGIVLSWGIPPKCNPLEATSHSDGNERIGSRSNIVSMLEQQRQHRLERLNRQYRNGLISGREWHRMNKDQIGCSLEEHAIDIDIDTW